jgi:4a-hydroxytetrahydrobiopterin dehydratase
MRKLLSETDLNSALADMDGWSGTTQEIARSYQFADFAAAMKFVNRVAELAEEAQHHPDIDIRYNRVRLGLSTHDRGGVTDRDVALARQIDSLPKVSS